MLTILPLSIAYADFLVANRGNRCISSYLLNPWMNIIKTENEINAWSDAIRGGFERTLMVTD